jgi:hypothetical protein
MINLENSGQAIPPDQWREVAMLAIRDLPSMVPCPVCHERSISAAWNLTHVVSREAAMDLRCSSCGVHETLRMTLPPESPGFYPFERVAMLGAAVRDEVESIVSRIRQHVRTMPAAAFTTNLRWAEARWSATTFRWHPTSEAPPVMGLVFDHAEAAKAIFREAERQMNHEDRFEEIRISIIEGAVAGQEQRPGYSVHLCPDPEALAAHATADDFVVNPSIVPFLGQWNRHYPIPGAPALLPRFKREFEKHQEFLLAPVTRRADGQLYVDHELGIIKNSILFRDLAEIATPDDPDAGALVLPQLITPPIG